MRYLKMSDLDLAGKRVLVREDLNAAMAEGRVTSDARLRAVLPTIRQAAQGGAKVMLLSHLGRPEEGRFEASLSLRPVAERLAELLGQEVRLVGEWLDGVELAAGEVVLCENVRFNTGETANDDTLAKTMAALCDIFVMDAFGSAHRAHASTHGVARHAPMACAGPLLAGELEALGKALENPARPLIAIVGGAKVSSKLGVLERLGEKADRLILGGGIANTFIAAAGHPVGASLHEPDLVDTAKRLSDQANKRGVTIPVPTDVVCAKAVDAAAPAEVKRVEDIADDDLILDLGPQTIEHLTRLLAGAGTIVWNGPVGMFELEPFAAGTRAIAQAVADSGAFSIAGGGETLAAIDAYGVAERLSYISTGGGAFLELLEGKTLPGVAILEERAAP